MNWKKHIEMKHGKRGKRAYRANTVDLTGVMSDARSADPAAGMYQLIFPLAYLFTLVYIFTVPFENAIVIEGIGSISRVVGILIFGMWILLLLLKQSIRIFPPFFIFSALFVVWCSFALLWSRNPDVVKFFLFTYIQLFMASYFIWLTLNDKKRCVMALLVYLFGACVAVSIVFWEFYTSDGSDLAARKGIEGVDFNELAMSISLALPIAWYLATKSAAGATGRLVTIVSYVFLPCGVLAIMMTGSRAGFASTLPVALYILTSLFYVSRSAKILAGLALIFSIVVVIQYIPEAQFARILTLSDEIESGNISGRGDLWKAAVHIWLASPLNSILGIGVGGFGLEFGIVAHSTFLSVLAETGLIGFVVFLFMLFSLFVGCMRSQRELRYMLLAIFVSWALGAATLTWEYAKITWLVWSLLVCVAYAFPRYSTTRKSRKRRKRMSHKRVGS